MPAEQTLSMILILIAELFHDTSSFHRNCTRCLGWGWGGVGVVASLQWPARPQVRDPTPEKKVVKQIRKKTLE
jgi:hypothetical protein